MGLLALLFSGCSPVRSDPRAVLEEKAAAVDVAAQDLLEALASAGLGEVSAHGIIDSCQSPPVAGVSYRAGIGVTVGDDLSAGYGALVKRLGATGWEPVEANSGAEIDQSTPAGRFLRDGITVDIKTGGFTSGGVRYGADEMDIGITIADDCVRVPDGGYIAEVQDLEKEILPRE